MNQQTGRYIRNACIYGQLEADKDAKEAIYGEKYCTQVAYLPEGGIPPTTFDDAKLIIKLFPTAENTKHAGVIHIKDDIPWEPLIMIRKPGRVCAAAIGICR